MNNIKLGLKLWSIDDEGLFKEAVQLFEKKEIDFVELYIVPDSFVLGKSNILNYLKNIPTVIHSTHTEHDFDVFWLDDSKIQLFKEQVIKTADFLNSKFIIVHAGVGDSQTIFEENIKKINDKRILIENMPKAGKIGTNNVFCFGYSCEQLKFIKDCGFDFCLDLAHTIKSAVSQKLDYKDFIKKLISELNPFYFHISNGNMNNEEDEHKNLFDGEFDIKWIKKMLSGLAKEKDIYLAFETPKEGNGLLNDIKNMNYFRSI
ncbi:TIM barrel protein [Patescibacteria group bacterium]|nr:TIM barrel protein [Patescibacteria group bacterium]